MVVTIREWTVGSKLWLLSSSLLLNLLLMGLVGQWNSTVLSNGLNDIADVQLPAVRNMTLTDMVHDGIRANAFHALILSGSTDAKAIKEVVDEGEEFAKNVDAYLNILRGLPLPEQTRREIEPVRVKLDAYGGVARQIVSVALAGDSAKAMAMLPDFQARFVALEDDLGKLGSAISDGAKSSVERAHASAERARWIAWVVVACGLLFGLSFSWLIVRDLQRSLKGVTTDLGTEVHKVSDVAAQLNTSANDLSQSSTNQAAAIQETAAAVDEISATVRKTAESSQELEKSAQISQTSAALGRKSIADMLGAFTAIGDSNTRVMTQVEEGNRKLGEIIAVIGEIGHKTKIIDDIVFQTKILSFNASVEAARAGDNGKGFAVVAEEVGNLAQLSGGAAREISDLLQSSVQRVEAIVSESKRSVAGLVSEGRQRLDLGRGIGNQCEAALEEIVHQSTGVSNMISEISTAIQEQNNGLAEIAKSLSLLDRATSKNSATSAETAKVSTRLLGQSQSLSHIVSLLKKLTLGNDQQ
jgi:methyl-accepting chemotaxis protein